METDRSLENINLNPTNKLNPTETPSDFIEVEDELEENEKKNLV